MSNEAIAVCLTAFYILFSRKLDLCFAILVYYAACIITNSYTTGLRFDASPEWFYIQQSIIDLSVIMLICYLSRFYHNFKQIYFAYAAIITLSMLINGLMLLDQHSEVNAFYQWHLAFQNYAQAIDVFFAIIGCYHVSNFVARFLPFGGR